jgi:hypothetical protein
MTIKISERPFSFGLFGKMSSIILVVASWLDENDASKTCSYPYVKGFHKKPMSLKKVQEMVKE